MEHSSLNEPRFYKPKGNTAVIRLIDPRHAIRTPSFNKGNNSVQIPATKDTIRVYKAGMKKALRNERATFG